MLRHRDLWLLSLTFGCFNMVVLAVVTYLPTFLNLVRGLSLPQAGLLAGISSLVSIASGPAADSSPTGSARASGRTWPACSSWQSACR